MEAPMATQVNLTLYEANTENINVTITTNVPAPGTALNLTGMTLEAYVKAAASTPDSDGGVWKGTTGLGDIVVTNVALGQVTVYIPGAAVTPTKGWWRVDVLAGSSRKTAVYGMLTVVDL
jgi:hypothetical protein